MIDCEVMCAWPGRSWAVALRLPEGATVADALAEARAVAPQQVDWACAVGVYGEPCGLDRRVETGDRIELYRPLAVDPKESRRQRAAATPRSGRGSLRR